MGFYDSIATFTARLALGLGAAIALYVREKPLVGRYVQALVDCQTVHHSHTLLLDRASAG